MHNLSAVSLGFLMQLVSALRDFEPMNIFDYCSDGVNYVLVPNDTKIAATMNGEDWPADSYICTVVFKAPPLFSQLYYKFTSFQTNQSEFEIEIATKTLAMYEHKGTYSMYTPPIIGKAILRDRNLKMSLSRKERHYTSISAKFEVFVKERNTSGRVLKDYHAAIIGSVVALIVVGAVCLLLVYLRYKYVIKRRVQEAKENQNGETSTTAVTAEEVPMNPPTIQTSATEDTDLGSSSTDAHPTTYTDGLHNAHNEQDDKKSTKEKLLQNPPTARTDAEA